jgi:choline kinase
MSFKYKVVILAAGLGRRMSPYTDKINKAILPVNHKAAISYIIDKFPTEVEIVIAVGHLGDTVRNFLRLAYEERNFIFVDVDNFDGSGAGPGYSLLCCADYLDCPFVFVSVDTLVLEDIPEPSSDWFGVAKVNNPVDYCTVSVTDGYVDQLFDKDKNGTLSAFIGLAGIRSYVEFFNALAKKQERINGEKQVSDGFSALVEIGLAEKKFTWFDTGNPEGYKKANDFFSNENGAFDFSKSDEFLYIQDSKVIKYFADNRLAENRYLRSRFLKGIVPNIECYKDGFYSYAFQDGDVAYDSKTPDIVTNFFRWASENLWIKKTLTANEILSFEQKCASFYKNKTLDRLNNYYTRFSKKDVDLKINGVLVPPLKKMLGVVPWGLLSNGMPGLFHGDLQFDNILELANGDFILLDWRQDFSGLIEYGDIYYDLAKLYGGLIVSYKSIKSDDFEFKQKSNGIALIHKPMEKMSYMREQFEALAVDAGYDFQKIRLITALIFLNMSPMHHQPFSHFIYYLGKFQLSQALESY